MKNSADNIISFRLPPDHVLNNRKLVYTFLFLLVFICMTAILGWKYFPTQFFQVKEGVVATSDIQAKRTFEVENEMATREAQSKALSDVKPVYKIDQEIVREVDSDIKSEFAIFDKLKKANLASQGAEVSSLKTELPISVSDSSLHTFLKENKENTDQMRIFVQTLANKAMSEIVRDDDQDSIKAARKQIRELASSIDLPEDQKKAVAELASGSIRPNANADWAETSRLRQERKDSVKPVMITIKKDQVIVGKGGIVTPEHIKILEAMGQQRSHFNLTGIAGIAILILLAIQIIWNYIRQSMPELSKRPKLLLLMILIVIATTLLCSLLIQVNPYLAPVPIAAMLTAILINPRVSLIVTALLSIMVGIMTGEIQYATVSLITGFASLLSVWKVNRRMDLVTAAVLVFLVNEVSVTVFSLLYGDTTMTILGNLVYGGINGFSSGIIIVGILPVLEHWFSITTNFRLLEISNQSEPLLNQLLVEAPGTYHHSIIVGNLAEAGAAVVGEDPLLCRVSSYYHDIGKLKRPYFFIENQLGCENPHDKLSPNLSALIIMSHVKDGLELGKKHKLPQPILDVICQHHGTNIIAYFYHQAQQVDKALALEEDFRYPGPQPRSKAAAIVMLADAVEAAARTFKHPTPHNLEHLVKSIVKKYLDDGQLDDCPLSLKNINDLTKTFTTILTGIYHHRIEYPDRIIEQVGYQQPKIASLNQN